MALFVVGAFHALPIAAYGTEPADDVQRIREVRALSNIAILKRDLATLRTTWLPELSVTISSGQVAASGDEMAQLFAAAFEDEELVTYVRTPREISLSPGGGLAAESGEWTGQWHKADGDMTVRGTYLAQWHKRDGRWLIRSEIFVALGCSGSSACDQLP